MSSQEFQEYRNNQKTQISEIYGLSKDVACENCGEKGHRTWACPLSLNQSWDKANVKCAICGDKSHPTCDCPEKNSKDHVMNTASEIENIYSKFMKEVKNDINGVLMLESDKTADIRNSVLWTGIVPKSTENKEDDINNEMNEKVSNTIQNRNEQYIRDNETNLEDLANPNENYYEDIHEGEDIETKLEYERELLEIENNKNIANKINNIASPNNNENIIDNTVKTVNANTNVNVSPNEEQINNNNNSINNLSKTNSDNNNNTIIEESKNINLPSQPILINNNIRQSAPISNLNSINPQQTNNQNMGNYYNTYLNPYAKSSF